MARKRAPRMCSFCLPMPPPARVRPPWWGRCVLANSSTPTRRPAGSCSKRRPDLREDEARVAAALQRLQIARTQLDDEANRLLRRRDELARRLSQLGEDIVREERLVSDNAQILARLDEEEAELLEILSDSGR